MKRKIKIMFQIILAIVMVVVLAIVITGGAILVRAFGNSGEFDYLLLLGTTVEGTAPSSMLQDRIDTAAEYLEQHPDVICVVTGGMADGENISEAQCMYNELTAQGIASNRIIMEDQATTTWENFQFSLDLLTQREGKLPETVGVVSSEFHLLRARMLAKSHGVEAVTIPAFSSNGKTFLTYFFREIFVVWLDGIKIAVQ